MSRWLQQRYHVLVFSLAAGLAVLSCGWSVRSWRVGRHRPDLARATVLAGARYAPAEYPRTEAAPAIWTESDNPNLRAAAPVEIFGAPPLYFDETRKVYRLAGRIHPEAGTTEAIELIAVVPELFPLQLTGYVGAPGDCRAIFAHRDGGTWLAREGESSASLGFVLKRFTVEKTPLAHGDRWPVHEFAARAVLLNLKTGEEVQLDSRNLKYTGARLAKFRLTAGRGPTSELREGDTFVDRGARHRVERIQTAPPEVVVIREAGGPGAAEKIIYRPPAAKPDAKKADGPSGQTISKK